MSALRVEENPHGNAGRGSEPDPNRAFQVARRDLSQFEKVSIRICWFSNSRS